MSGLKSDSGMPWCPGHLLAPGETAIWWARPAPRHYAFSKAWFLVFVGSIFAVIGGVASASALRLGFRWEALLSLAVAGFGIWMPIVAIRKCFDEARTVIYLLTDMRAIIEKPPAVISVVWSAVKFVELDMVTDKHGNVLFYEYVVEGAEGPSRVRDGFIGIADAAAVEREMRRLQSAAAA
jgi:hypothetical protein